MHRTRVQLLGALACLGLAAAAALAQPAPDSAPPAPAADSASPAPSPYSHLGADFTFMFDGYVDKNFNNPSSGWNQLRNFDMRSNTAHFNMGMVTIDRAPAPVGFHLDVGFGQIFSVTHATDKAPEELKYFKQAYVSLKPKSWHGLEIDAGEFVTSAGAEVIETNQNWNYSRSLLFAWAIPYYHFGIRASMPVGHFTGGVQVVNGWNNVKDNNSGKTVGLTGAYAWKKVTWSNVYYVGPEKDHTNSGKRQLYDTTVLVTPNSLLSVYINGDYGRDKRIGEGANQWVGLAGAARVNLGKTYAVAGRLEIFNDMDGFSTGAAQTVKEGTFTFEYRPSSWLISRFEVRKDWSNQAFFEKENGFAKSQTTALLGLVAYFGPKR